MRELSRSHRVRLERKRKIKSDIQGVTRLLYGLVPSWGINLKENSENNLYLGNLRRKK